MSAAFNIPSDWKETTFGTVVSPVSVNGKKLPKGEYLESGRFPVVDQGKEFIGGYSNDETRVISNELPLLVFGDHTRAFKYLDQPFVPGADGIKVLKPVGVNAKWLYQMAQALEFPDKGYARHYQHLKSAKLFVPPLPEQRRIVAEIEKQFTRLEAGVAALRRVQANLKRYRAAVLKTACEGRLVPGDKRHWRQTTLKDVCSTVTDGDHQPPPKVSDGTPFLTIGDISSGRLDFSDTRFVPAEYFARIKSDRVPRRNDVLYSVVGATIGIPVLVNVDRQFCFQRHIALLKPSSVILPGFLWLFMASPETFREAWAKTTGSAQPTLPLKALRALPISLPPLAEQTRIVAEVERRLSVVEELEAVVSANLQRAGRLRQSILQKAFTGELV